MLYAIKAWRMKQKIKYQFYAAINGVLEENKDLFAFMSKLYDLYKENGDLVSESDIKQVLSALIHEREGK